MPKKNKTACKRRKCQRSRRLIRNHNRRRVRTIRRGGWPWTRKPTPPTPTFIETLLENREFRYMKQRLDHEKMLRDASDKMKSETEERNLLWLQQKQQEAQLQKEQQEQQQEAQWQKRLAQFNPTRTADQGKDYRNQLSGLYARFERERLERERLERERLERERLERERLKREEFVSRESAD